MESFPDLVLINIFKMLEYKERRSCAKVCRRWRTVMDRNVGMIVYLGKENVNLRKIYAKYLQDIQTITEFGISDCIVGGEIDEEIPDFKYPHLVNSIRFYSLLSAGKFNTLVRDLTKLRKLVIHAEFLTGAEMDTISLTFSTLTTFELRFPKVPAANQVPMTWNQIQNIVHLLDRAIFPQLQHLSLAVPWWRDIEEFLLAKIFSFILRHKKHLKTLQLALIFTVESERPIDDNPLTMEPLPSIMMSDLREIQLDKLYLFSNCSAVIVIDDYFTHLLSNQRRLTYYNDTECFPAFSFPTLTIQNNAKTLVTINISFHSDLCRLIDCALVFADCTSLIHLSLCNFKNEENFEGVRIKALNGLPKSLESIQLLSLRSEEDLGPLIFELPNLKVLVLRRTLDVHGQGLPANAILEILRKKMIKEVYVEYQPELTEDFLLTLKQSSGSYPFVKKILKDFTKNRYMHFHLGNAKYKRGPNKERIFQCKDDFPPNDFLFRYPPPPDTPESQPQPPPQVILIWDTFITAVREVRQRVLLFLARRHT